MYSIEREYWFSSAHRLEGHPKCGRLHGHNYKVTVVVTGGLLNGMVLDYAEVDKIVKPAIDKLDHRYIVSIENVEARDPYYSVALANHVVSLLILASTAEHLAEWFWSNLYREFIAKGCKLLAVRVDESHKSSAVYEPDPYEAHGYNVD